MYTSAFLTAAPARAPRFAHTNCSNTSTNSALRHRFSSTFVRRSHLAGYASFKKTTPSQTSRFHTVRMVLPEAAEKSMTVLVVGSGGREHALVQSLSRSPYLSKLLAAPGNVGIASICECVSSVSADDVDGIVALAVARSVTLVVVGPEVPLVLGLVDRLRDKDIAAFGPSAGASLLEGDKIFSKCFLERHNIPTATFAAFNTVEPARLYIQEMGAPIVVKAAGLAAGKGVLLCKTVEDAYAAVDAALVDAAFGAAGDEIVIEEYLQGEELSFFAIVDGTAALPLASAQDHKAAFDGDEGPNTGGMGAYSPAPLCNNAMQTAIMQTVVFPTIKGMKSEGNEFRGILYCGLMVDAETGDFRVLEFNVRFGDPECQVLCPRLKTDMLELLVRASTGRLQKDDFQLEWHKDAALVVVMATGGYPGPYESGSAIRGVEAANGLEDVTVYHAGTALNETGELVANGGRVLGVTAKGASIREAQKKAYEGIDAISWAEGFCRRDIGWRAIAHEESGK